MDMTFQDAVRSCLSQDATFPGRARRSEYGSFVLFTVIGPAIAGVTDSAPFGSIRAGCIASKPRFLDRDLHARLSAQIHRLHDTGTVGLVLGHPDSLDRRAGAALLAGSARRDGPKCLWPRSDHASR